MTGLTLALETRGENGVHVRTEFDSALEKQSQPRLAVEANVSGYLYAGRIEGGTWHWLFPPSSDEVFDASVQSRREITLPIRIGTQRSHAPQVDRLSIILSRRSLREMGTEQSWTFEREVLARDILDLLAERSEPDEREATVVEQSREKIYAVAHRSTGPLIVEVDVQPLF